jgi:uncharacterized membrane protein (UPF0127 family)
MFRTFLAAAALTLAGHAVADLPRVELTAGFHRIEAEVAANPADRSQGLMHRRALAPNQGMVFVFPATATHCFWMRNTPLPLSIAFIDDDGTILQIADMAPKSDALHCSERPVRYALEMEQGWYAKKGALVGSRLRGLPAPR